MRRDGDTLVDIAYRCEPTNLFWTFSASKALTSVVVWRLVERGLIDLDAPVATYWPAYGAGGKDEVTVRQVMQHRSGMATGNALTFSAYAKATSADFTPDDYKDTVTVNVNY